MSLNVLSVVGARFTGFANENPEVITLAKLERMRLREGLPGDMTLIVLNPLDATYHAFGFPLGMDIEYHGMSRKESKGGSLTCEARVCFIQGSELLTEEKTRFAVFMRGVEAKKGTAGHRAGHAAAAQGGLSPCSTTAGLRVNS